MNLLIRYALLALLVGLSTVVFVKTSELGRVALFIVTYTYMLRSILLKLGT